MPPISADSARETGVVVAFGAIVRASSSEPPSSCTSRIAEPTETSTPSTSATIIGSAKPRRRCSWRCSGTARATVAGPSRKVSTAVPSA